MFDLMSTKTLSNLTKEAFAEKVAKTVEALQQVQYSNCYELHGLVGLIEIQYCFVYDLPQYSDSDAFDLFICNEFNVAKLVAEKYVNPFDNSFRYNGEDSDLVYVIETVANACLSRAKNLLATMKSDCQKSGGAVALTA